MLVQHRDDDRHVVADNKVHRVRNRRSCARCAPAPREFTEQLIANVAPWTARFRIVAILSQSVTKKLPVPIRYADFFWRCGNSVPKRLNVLNLLLDRQFVETGWWDG